MPIEPRPEQLQALTTDDRNTPVVMLNLLRFRPQAKDEEGMSGEEAYARYGAEVFEHLQRVGGEVVWRGTADSTVIGPEGEEWDQVILVRYPSRKAFIEMVSDPAYQEIARWRGKAVEDSRLVAMTEA